MNIRIEDIPMNAQKWEVKQAFSQLLHYHPDLRHPSADDRRLLNFEITLEPSYNGSASNGRGTLTLPHKAIGDRFYNWARRNHVFVNGRKVWICKSEAPLKRGLVEALNRTPYLDPREQAERQEKLEQIRQIRIVLDAIQFGVYYHRPEDPPTAHRYFSNEFEICRDDTISGELLFDYNRKLFRVEMGNCVTEDTVDHVVIDLNNIKKSACGSTPSGQCYVCFEFWQPPRLERQARLRAYTGDRRADARGFRERLPHLGGEHEVITPFANQLRLVLNDPRAHRDIRRLCEEAEIPTPSKVQINVDTKGFFSPDKLKTTRQWILSYDWPIRFQLEALLRTGLVHTDDVLGICDSISRLVRVDGVDFAADFLRRFSAENLRSKGNGETVLECFKTALRQERADTEASQPDAEDTTRSKGFVQCAHAIVTPTRVLLEGPYDTQSNRVIRKYYVYRENFIRVEFREENRLSFRWPLEVNGRSLIEQRFGKILKQGLEIAGRIFRFLGYSTSGLREHTVWFMSDFEHPEEGLVTPEKIRSSLGDFKSCINHPSKYAARIAQAFSGTDPSYKLQAGQWTEGVADLGSSPYEFTDGQGTISVELRDRIWEVLCQAWPDKKRLILKPSAFQIRFLGCKGIVVVDEQLEGVHMKLRNSMKKFAVNDAIEAEIEIAKAFIKPGPARLCRPLIAVLEDRGVSPQAFLDLQKRAKKDVITMGDTIKNTIDLLRNHDLGNVYGLRWTLQYLADAGMGMGKEVPAKKCPIDNKFIRRLIKFAQTHLLAEIKHEARISIQDAYQLVGCADEGPAYIAEGHDPNDVLCLEEGQIFACVQQPDQDEPTYIKGIVSISRSPHIHPGDVQRVRAIGKPPDNGQKCFFRNLKNVVVMPSVGNRSLASMLAGGDVDGDEFLVIKDPTLLPTTHAEPASYEGVPPRLLERESDINDICNFFVEYMQSDVVGLVADLHLTIADQSKYGTSDRDCMRLAGLCSQAVDYPKNGVPVNLEDLPHTIIHAKPDWKKPEDNDYRPADFYESTRALGVLFRNIEVQSITPPSSSYPNGTPLDPVHERPLSDNISQALRPAIERHLGRFNTSFASLSAIEPLFRHYARELGYICLTHAPSENTDVRLCEEEVALGAILAKCSQRRWKKDRMHRMREHAAQLVRDVRHRQRALGVPLHRDSKDGSGPPEEELRAALERGWAAWDFGMRNRTTFGAQSFALIGLNVVCDMLERLDKKAQGSDSSRAFGSESEPTSEASESVIF